MIYIDSNIPMYLVGSEHPNKKRVIELVPQLLAARERFVTSAETFQEVLHRYLALHDRVHMNAAFEALDEMVSRIFDVTKGDVDAARALSGAHVNLSSRDCLHVAVMTRIGCSRVWSYDAAFDDVGSVVRIE